MEGAGPTIGLRFRAGKRYGKYRIWRSRRLQIVPFVSCLADTNANNVAAGDCLLQRQQKLSFRIGDYVVCSLLTNRADCGATEELMGLLVHTMPWSFRFSACSSETK